MTATSPELSASIELKKRFFHSIQKLFFETFQMDRDKMQLHRLCNNHGLFEAMHNIFETLSNHLQTDPEFYYFYERYLILVQEAIKLRVYDNKLASCRDVF